jgi:hypothetical protein
VAYGFIFRHYRLEECEEHIVDFAIADDGTVEVRKLFPVNVPPGSRAAARERRRQRREQGFGHERYPPHDPTKPRKVRRLIF